MADQPKASTSTRAIPPPLNSALRKPTPSPLQVSQISTPLTNNFVHTGPKDFGSPHSSKGDAGTSPFTPRSPHYSPVFLSDQNDSLNGGELSSVASRNATQEPMRPDVSERRKHSPLVTPRGNELQATRNVSALSQSSAAVTTDSPPHSPSEIALSKVRAVDHRPVERLGPRTSSIDSTMSSVSSTTSYSHASSDPLSPSPAEIAQMVASAGSVDQLIRQLVKEKKQSAAQNAQLWRLINKQRTLIMGLNEDFARALEEKKKYHQRYKELSASLRPHPTQRVDEVRKMSPSGTSSAGSDEELPIQRHSALLSGKQQAPFMGESGSTEEGDAANHTVDHRATAILSPTQVPSQVSPSTTSPSIPSEGMPKAMQESEASDASDEDDSRRHTIMQSNFRAIAPFEMHKKLPPAIDPSSEPRTPLAQDVDMGPSPSSFSARRSLTTPRKSAHNSPHVGGDSPIEGPPTLTSPMSRRGPPAPLNLQQRPVQPPQPLKSPDRYGPEDRSEPEYDEALEAERAPKLERGRRKTREEDDKEREFVMKKEAESRSQSKKQKRPKSGSKSGPASPTKQSATSPTQSLPKSPVIRAFSPNESPTSLQEHFSPHASLAGVLSGPSSSANSIVEQSVTIMASPPLSPGLPRSPRPIDRPLNSPAPRAPIDSNVSSPPLSPRPGTLSPPELLSPRAPRHPIPLPPHTPTSLTSPHCSISEDDKAASMRSRSPTLQPPPQSPPNLQPPQSPKSPVKALSPQSPKSPRKGTSAPLAQVSSNPSSENMSAGIFRGFRSEAYPDLLLPPNALPLILIKVTSSRLRPSRHSMLSMKSMEEDPVFTLGITARSNMKPLWRVEKPIMSMPQLDQQLKQISSFEFRLPDRSLFTGHAPAKIDARREALERYFEDVLDTEMRDPAALILCNFLSSQVVPVEDYEGSNPSNSNEGPQQVHLGPDGRIIKEGFLTKRGKNFGGWKARYFVLDEPVLRYYESPGGALLGTIKLMNAQIGKQAANHSSSHSPSRAGEEHDKEFRHAFLILEPKKKDSNSFLRHVLCAESDAERDDWVGALLQYIGQIAPEGRSKTASKGILSSMMRSGKEESPVGSERSHEDSAKGLQGVNYEDTVAGQPVKMGSSQGTPSPLSSSFNGNQGMMASPPSRSISGPTNGVVIQDPQAFNKRPVEGPKVRDTQKKRSLFAFRDRQPDSNASTPNNSMAAMARPQTSSTMGRPVFGMPLAEAVETFPARGSDLALPAVVYRCLEYLEAKEAVDEEGIFRLSGSNVVIKQLRERFNTEGDVDFLGEGTHYDVHAIASLLKAYLRELPANVLGPRELQVRFATVLELDEKPKKIAAYNILVHRLPNANWTLLRALSAFLISVVNNSSVNKMSVRNVGIVFSPTLQMPAPIFAAFLTDFDAIFGTPPLPNAHLPLHGRTHSQDRQQQQQQQQQEAYPYPQAMEASSPRNAGFGSHAPSYKSDYRARSETPDSRRSDSRTRPPLNCRKTSSEQSSQHISQQSQQSQQQQQQQPSSANLPTLHNNNNNYDIHSSSSRQHPAAARSAPSLSVFPTPQSSSSSTSGGLGVPHARQRESQAQGPLTTNVMRDRDKDRERDAKARRRESSMMLMNMGPSAGARGAEIGMAGGLGMGMAANAMGNVNGGRKGSLGIGNGGMNGGTTGGGRDAIDMLYDEDNIRI